MYFIVEHPSDFCDIQRLWVDECHKIKHPQLPSVHSEFVNKLHKQYLAKRTSTSNYSLRYVQRVYPRSRVADGECRSFEGIF